MTEQGRHVRGGPGNQKRNLTYFSYCYSFQLPSRLFC